jgi:hypothetical protein
MIKGIMLWINGISLIFGGAAVLGIAANPSTSKDMLIVAILAWLYILCNLLAIKKDWKDN